ncbi:signal recognition particle protein [Bacteroidetes bacterium endosymbiont of Geopemphigus sp.]|uniref:signal recognition particle protein n=1 Tax=Bacteroidetes bacterium endosymbiont of Geopemphigus sp. TaxID=2047937 RepID=UPI000CD027CE|nr:signal recognition particle protein [Bacteroidetes bacterium endosymbiont of Geopemphigus sp.]
MFDNLQEQLDRAFHILKGRGKITEINIAETLKEVRRALLNADVNFKVAKEFTNKIKEKSLGQKVLTSLQPGQLIIKIVHDELVQLMGGQNVGIDFSKTPTVVLIAGLQGSGKTTFSGKLAHFLESKKHKKPLLVAADVYRPAAIEQLKVLGGQIQVPVFTLEESKNPLEITEKALDYGRVHFHDVVIVDTAGRLAVDEVMMKEIKAIHEQIHPDETLFVVDAMTGQDAVNTAKAFNESLNYQGIVLTKLDGDTRGGAALSIRSVVNKPIKFISNGEKLQAIDIFYPERMANRILGMGDVVSLVEKACEQFDEEQAKKLYKKIAKNNFSFDDFLKQIQQIKKMGNMKDLLGMIPGLGKMTKNIDLKEDTFKQTEAIIYSMTLKERKYPKIIDMGRKKRIAKGSGTSIKEVERLLKQFGQMSQLMRQMQTPFGREMLKTMTAHMGNNKT